MNITATITGSIVLIGSSSKDMSKSVDEVRLKNGLTVKVTTSTVRDEAVIIGKTLRVLPKVKDIPVTNVHTMFVMNYPEIKNVEFSDGLLTIDEPALKCGKLISVILPESYTCNCARAFSNIKCIVFKGRDSFTEIPGTFLEELFEFGVHKVVFDKQVVERRE